MFLRTGTFVPVARRSSLACVLPVTLEMRAPQGRLPARIVRPARRLPQAHRASRRNRHRRGPADARLRRSPPVPTPAPTIGAVGGSIARDSTSMAPSVMARICASANQRAEPSHSASSASVGVASDHAGEPRARGCDCLVASVGRCHLDRRRPVALPRTRCTSAMLAKFSLISVVHWPANGARSAVAITKAAHQAGVDQFASGETFGVGVALRGHGALPATGTMSVVVDPISTSSAVPAGRATRDALACQLAEAMSSTCLPALSGLMKSGPSRRRAVHRCPRAAAQR